MSSKLTTSAARPGKFSIKNQLALLENPGPVDFDPEALENEYPDSESDARPGVGGEGDNITGETKLATEHYITVGKSKLRKWGIPLPDPKYNGTRISRKRLFEDESEDDDTEGKGEDGDESELDARRNNGKQMLNECRQLRVGNVEGEDSDAESEDGGVKFTDHDGFESDESEDIDSNEAFRESDIGKGLFQGFRFRENTMRKSRVGPKKGDSGDIAREDEEGTRDIRMEREENMEEDKIDGEGEEDEDEISDEDGEDNEDEDEDEDEETEEDDHKKTMAQREELRKIMTNERKVITTQISQNVKTDVQKGQAVRHQQSTFDNFLGARIKLQKAVNDVNTINPTVYTSEAESHQDLFKAAEEGARKLWSLITDMRTNISEHWKLSTTKINCESHPLKRKRPHTGPIDASLTTLWSTMSHLESQASPLRNIILSKWSQKLTSSSSTAILNSKKLHTASHPSNTILTAINNLLTNDLDRLIKKTKILRASVSTQDKTVSREDTNSEVFDDTDFYTTLLKQLINTRMVDSTLYATYSTSSVKWTTAAQLLQESKVASKKSKKIVDTKASKGRKLRYQAHEKLVSFMVPQRGILKWQERQVDELFGSLLGMKGMRSIDENSEDDDGGLRNGNKVSKTKRVEEDEQIEMPDDGLRIFG